MQAGVPQFIDVEDKIAFGLTGKQLLWIGAAVALLVVSFGLFNRQVFYAVAFFIVVIFGALAFWRPQGVSMVSFIGFSLYFFLKPKKYIWKRVYKSGNIDLKKAALAQRKNAPPIAPPKHLPGGGSLKRIAWELDTRK